MAIDWAAWLKQGQRDLDHARRALDDGDYEWTCFAAQQAAEKALKAVYGKVGAVAWGHSVTALLEGLPGSAEPEAELLNGAKELDRHYIPSRYPNSYPQGAPYEYYTQPEAERAIDHAARLIRVCENLLAGPGGDAEAPSASGSATG